MQCLSLYEQINAKVGKDLRHRSFYINEGKMARFSGKTEFTRVYSMANQKSVSMFVSSVSLSKNLKYGNILTENKLKYQKML